jgi:dipeptidyl aminopeptidase/acylaminoacyl peptidase
MDLARGTTRPVTAAGFDAGTAWWSPDGAGLLVASNEGSRHSVRLWNYPVGQPDGLPTLLTPGEGVIENAAGRGSRPDAAWSPNGKQVAYGISRPDDAFQLAVAEVTGGTPTVLYSATAESIPLDAQARIRAVEFPARDGTPIPGVLLEPRRADAGARRPALVFHYGGWNQQARLGWHLGPKWRLFEYLVSRGWVVLIADVRGSDGYGRAHAHAAYHDGGGRQATDLADAAAWLRQQSFVDPTRIALFGHSYGAYLALTTLLREPDAFQAGVLMAGVFDFAGFSAGTYLEIRFGNPKAPAVPVLQFRPALYLNRLQAPVLVYHGTNDFNAPMLFSEQLVRGLMKEGRDYEFSVYPDEPHDWDREETERDFLVRTERFLVGRLGSGARRDGQ